MNKPLLAAALAAAVVFAPVSASAAPIKADVMSIVDESGSMSGEHAWLGGMIASLDAGLVTAGLTGGNQYGLTGFGRSASGAPSFLRQVNVGGGQFGTAAQLGAAAATLVTTGGTEDGYAGINFANTNYTFRGDAARNYILVTDEDRDNTNGALNYANTLSSLTASKILLNAVVNATFRCADGSPALGIDSKGFGYKADGAGGYTSCAGGVAVSGAGSTVADYVALALASGGAAWDLNQLRAGGLTATSFTSAFVAIKVEEIKQQDPDPIPEPGTMSLLGLGLAGVLARRRQKKA